MSYSPESYERDFYASDASLDTRGAFLRRVYGHVFGAVALMVVLIAAIVSTPLAGPLLNLAMHAWWAVLIGFVAVTWIAQKMAYSQSSVGTQYMGLGLYVLAQSVILTPMILIAMHMVPNGGTIVLQAAGLTLLVFGGLTAVVLYSGADFSFLKGAVTIGSLAAVGAIIISLVFGVNLGTWFSVAMIVLLAGTILWETSVIRNEWPTDAHVAASLALFGSLSTMFFYILRLLLAFAAED